MTSLTKRFEIKLTTTLRKNLGPSMLKQRCPQEDKSRKQHALFCVLSN